jgi:cobalt/nickel transport system ATP-binding protein
LALSEPAIELHELRFSYPHGCVALHGVSFRIESGQRIGLVGPNGAGKTSLFLCLCGVLPAVAKQARVAGINLCDPVQRKRLPTEIGIVFQNPDDQLFNSTILDDVAFGPLNQGLPSDQARIRAIEALESVGLKGFEDRVPWRLSGGEKRRAALAGVLAMRPRILLLDEPSMFLDPRGRRGLIDLLRGIGGTQVIATHDLELVLQTCERVLLLDSGKLFADGRAAEVLGDADLMLAHGLEVPASLSHRR